MTELKEEIYTELQDELYQKIAFASYAPGVIAITAQDLKNAIREVLQNKLSDLIIIDRKKFKEKLDVVYRGYSGDNMYNPYSHFENSLKFVQYFTPETVMSVDIDILKDRMKDAVIAKLEECDF